MPGITIAGLTRLRRRTYRYLALWCNRSRSYKNTNLEVYLLFRIHTGMTHRRQVLLLGPCSPYVPLPVLFFMPEFGGTSGSFRPAFRACRMNCLISAFQGYQSASPKPLAGCLNQKTSLLISFILSHSKSKSTRVWEFNYEECYTSCMMRVFSCLFIKSWPDQQGPQNRKTD